ncbi:MAG: lipoate--protein ligase family protein, partial [Pirellulales bacterium]|nr:lipoate--protein ligase family protein [Pirellulales bacterium]
SLGYFQRLADRDGHRESARCDIVRRVTGGGAIVHDDELTYSLVVPLTTLGNRRPDDLYSVVHAALIHSLARFGVSAERAGETPREIKPKDAPFLCFERRSDEDVVIGRNKIAGSAQRRRKDAVLQHGSVLLARSPFAPQLAGVRECVRGRFDGQELKKAWLSCLGDEMNFAFEADELTGEEQSIAGRVEEARYGNDNWTRRR